MIERASWPPTPLTKTLLALCWVLFVAHVAMLVWAWPLLPEQLPMHFGISGQPDSWAGKGFVTLGVLPLVHLLMLATISWVLPHPEWSNLPSTTRFVDLDATAQRRVAWVLQGLLASIAGLVSLIFSVLSLSIVRIGLGQVEELPSGFMVLPVLVVLTSLVGLLALRRCIPRSASSAPE